MDPSGKHVGWAGGLGALVGFVIVRYAPLDAMLPLNRPLFALVCSLLTIWVSISVTRVLEGKR